MTNCPPKLRGDLSKWLCEINTGVYVGQISGRVRDAVWERVCKNLRDGQATMVFTTNNEQHMDFRVHNTTWEPVDFDGIKLMRRPLSQNTPAEPLLHGFSNAAKYQMTERMRKKRGKKPTAYVIIDLETTGLHAETDWIIEYGAIRVRDGIPCETFSTLVQRAAPLPSQITELTGITDDMLQAHGQPPQQALTTFLQFIGKDKLIGHNISFDFKFLQAECLRYDCSMPANRSMDLLQLARRKVSGVENYKLATLAAYFSLPEKQQHRALSDCELVQKICEKLEQI